MFEGGSVDDWAEWELFLSDTGVSNKNSNKVPPVPALIHAYLDREDVRSGQLAPEPITPGTSRPNGAREVSLLLNWGRGRTSENKTN
jgi:hypothetical protein